MMNKSALRKILATLMALMMLCGIACAETVTESDAAASISSMPQRGLVFPFTESDVAELCLGTMYIVSATNDIAELPVAAITFTDEEGMAKALSAFTEEQLSDPDMRLDIFFATFPHNHHLYFISLFEQEYYDAQIAAGKAAQDLLGVENVDILGENDGYVYIGYAVYAHVLAMMETDTQKAAAEQAIARCKEIVSNLSFQPVVFDKNEITEVPESDLVFSTKDLNGNVVTNELFAGKKLTVLNVWGTFCDPCIEEMPELAEWSLNMPEDVQLVGLVSDLLTYDDAEILETAQLICEATGAEVYTNLVANEDFAELFSSIVGVPTTFFINENGEFIGSYVIGANVEACKAFVKNYLAE